jgi:homocysteine S-methyltransferase
VVVLDGGLATELERRGAVLDSTLWSAKLLLDDPAALVKVHRFFLEAGADCIAVPSSVAGEMVGPVALGATRQPSGSKQAPASWEAAAV